MRVCINTKLNRILCYDADMDQLVVYQIVDNRDDCIIIDEYCDYFENCSIFYWANVSRITSEQDLPFYCQSKSNSEVTSKFYDEAFKQTQKQLNKNLWIDYGQR